MSEVNGATMRVKLRRMVMGFIVYELCMLAAQNVAQQFNNEIIANFE